MNSALTRTILAATIAASVGITLFSASLTLASPNVRLQAAANVVWLPDTALTATLGPQVVVAGYRMRLPVGYTADLKKEQANPAFKAKFFSLHRADDAGPTMFVMALSFPPSDGGGTAAQVMDGDGYIHGRAGLVKTEPQVGHINGLKAVRQYFRFSGSDGQERHGFHYVVMDGAKRLLIVVVDDEPRSKTSLPLAEASVLTLRK